MESTEAILLRRSRLTETSLIVTWASPELGVIRTVAKGALRPGSPFRGRLDLFFSAGVVLARSRRSDLHQLREVSVCRARHGLARDYLRLQLASYYGALVEAVTEPEAPLEGLWPLLATALDYCDEGRLSRAALGRFERRVCAALGLGELDEGGAVTALRGLLARLPPQREALWETLPVDGGQRTPSQVNRM